VQFRHKSWKGSAVGAGIAALGVIFEAELSGTLSELVVNTTTDWMSIADDWIESWAQIQSIVLVNGVKKSQSNTTIFLINFRNN
jgi:hypothetical protein